MPYNLLKGLSGRKEKEKEINKIKKMAMYEGLWGKRFIRVRKL